MTSLPLFSVFLFASVAFARVIPISQYGKPEDRVDGAYTVIFEKDAKAEWEAFKQQAKDIKSPISDLWEIGDDFRGFGGHLSEDDLWTVQNLPGVAYIEQDMWVHALGQQNNVAAWGIDRSDQQQTALNRIYKWRDNGDGSGSTVYILDTGILTRHTNFGGRARFGVDCMTSVCNPNVDTGDVQGHGTHCAGSAASTTYGIAKRANLVNVRVLGDNGSSQGNSVISGVNWAAGQPGTRKVLSMSLGSAFSSARNAAVNAAHRAGSIVVVAAGNANSDACRTSPASAEEAVTVGSIQQGDRRSGFSNYGRCVNLFAPGTSILSTSNRGGTATMSGTSMSTPHVAGAVALIHSRGNYTANQARNILYSETLDGIIQNPGTGSPNKLMFTNPGF